MPSIGCASGQSQSLNNMTCSNMLVCRQSSKVKITLKFTVVLYYANVVWPSVCVEHVNKKRVFLVC